MVGFAGAVVARHTGSRRIILAGHSLGGTLAAPFAALHPSCVAALVLLEAPTPFAEGGTFARWFDGLASAADPRASLNYLRVARWTLDEFPMSGIFLGEVVDQLYREDRFMHGTLSIAGRAATPAALAMPVLNVMRPESLVIPPEMIRRFHEKIPRQNKRLLRYVSEIGVALRHIGVLVGPHAHRELWPEIAEWARGAARPSQSNKRRSVHGQISVPFATSMHLLAGEPVERSSILHCIGDASIADE